MYGFKTNKFLAPSNFKVPISVLLEAIFREIIIMIVRIDVRERAVINTIPAVLMA